ncbi:hypothetical protein D9613_011872 [Agrocybe pediades]|uniref:F-box domain-containing protein n=1 Tax=Agrocybe pediades TaxID=84607 RepID=A0A8H4QKI6_9AGAR|nr:hypothetical protein D9613_011872 [Agrocybe pediades]
MDSLPPEIYWNIFMMNTERGNKPLELYIPEADHRLDTARNCSQVCRLWRALLLQLSSVWGRLLHLQNLEHTTDAWREVVASRIGEASLWITGKVTDSTRRFIFAILQEKWQNVQELEIKDENLYDDEILPTWSFLEREAPKLEVFELTADMCEAFGLPALMPTLPFSPLFRNTAPRLKIFQLWEPFHFSLPAPWMANLHSVTFFRPQNGPLILSALKSMPLLRELYVYGGNTLQPMFPAEDGDLDKPHLPLLESLTLDPFYYPMDMILLLESITLPPGQRLLRKLVIREVYEDHQRVHCSVTKWIHAYISASPPRHLSLSDYQRILTLEDIRDIGSGEGMRVDIVLDDTQSHATIEEIAASLRYSVVEELDVALTDSAFARPLRPLFAVLQSVTHLTADGDYLEPLFHDMLQFSLFPNLHTIYFRGTSLHPDWDFDYEEANTLATLKRFLEHRVQIGSPVSVLDLSSVHPTALPNNLNKERLIQIPGLSVVLPEDRKV